MDRFVLSTEIISGADSFEFIRTLKTNSVCIVTDKVMMNIGTVKRVTDILDDLSMDYHVFDHVEASPSLETVFEGLHHIIENKPGVLIAVGGGSVIDAAKAIIYFCIKTKEVLIDTAKIVKPEFVAIPTTSGTGSEVTSYSVITDHVNQRKVPLFDRIMLPDIAILDPAFTISVPAGVTADTGMDVITHAIEAFASLKGTRLSSMYAEKALTMAFGSLLKVFYNGNNKIERARMHEAACMAGVSFTNAGLGINHSLAHAIDAKFHISHGRANAMLLPIIVSFNSGIEDNMTEQYGKPYEEIAELIGINKDCRIDAISCLIALIEKFNEKLNIPSQFRDLGVQRKDFFEAVPQMANDALYDICTQSNPRKVTKQDLERLLYKLY